ncbi:MULTISPECIES: tryptophan 2,3-dioxygenase [unclassified Nocardioides]|uniref:tryptophan 2,3-dioxygenase n=1 Tax=unclassified Nocardioides TaxID=2615069 RepID=UPI0006FC9A35|nr:MULTISPECIES: tryptophan 2,3-dioxygenase [unclassified Nocardioides]KQY56881.1 tryptophan 2,3-dioxygenase [Nocardioides sp. Root140]KQZ66923.1 tryptophan 2,3-dioxygenase [Nocardioides sp. Root151]KRF13003.1 tryptophan 2,3-dioxygenase [Nocardioides sp. Soil796]
MTESDRGVDANTRAIEDTVVTDFSERMSYGGYLDLPTLLSAQRPVSDPVHPDELLFIVQHQTTELWLKLVLHELERACALLRDDDLAPALKSVARVKHIQKTLTEQWSVLATLTPSEYAEFRDALGNSSGFQSWQYRAVEFTLGNKNAAMLKVFDAEPVAQEGVRRALEAPSLYDEFLRYLARHGYPIPADILERDVTKAWTFREDLVPVLASIYADASHNWSAYETCEELVDLEDNFQLWRFRHLKTVERIIGMKTGTGGSSGAPFLKKALELTFFPELYAVRTTIGT